MRRRITRALVRPLVRAIIGASVLAVTPAVLFGASEPGIWLDNADWNTTWYQDAAGTTPITAMEQPLGLALSKDGGLKVGAELITPAANRDFSSDTGFWLKDPSVTISGGLCRFTNSGANDALYKLAFLTVGSYYEITIVVASLTSGALKIGCGGGSSYLGPITSAGTYVLRGLAFSSGNLGVYAGIANTNATVSSVSWKKVAGNHVYQSTSGVRPVVSARYSLLTKTEDWENAVWTRQAGGVGTAPIPTNNYGNAPDGTQTAARLRCSLGGGTATSDISYITQGVFGSGYAKRNHVYAKSNTGVTQYAYQRAGNKEVTIAITTSWQVFDADSLSSDTGGSWAIGLRGGQSTPCSDALDILVWHPDARPTDQATGLIPTYQRVNTSSDYDGPDKGFPPYISLNGTQWMQTAATDYSGVNKMLIIAGVRAQSVSTLGVICELSSVSDITNGTFALTVYTTPNATFQARGTALAFYQNPISALPWTKILGGQIDTAASGRSNQLIPRINGVITQNGVGGAADIGATNFANAAMYIGARAGSAYFLTGRIYQLIARGSTVAANDSQISVGESYSRVRSRAY